MTTPTQSHPAEMAHTPTPWAVSSSTLVLAPQDKRDIAVICNTLDLVGVCDIGIQEARANAAFIVTACNSYHAQQAAIRQLREALGAILNHSEKYLGLGDLRIGGKETEIVASARSALESTKGLAP